MSDTNDLVLDTFGAVRQQAQTAATANIDASPDEAQRAIELGKTTGVHPTTILGDLETFEKNHKATLASDIVKNNSFISDYIAAQPMASKISNDDYGQLDTISQRMTQMYPDGLKWLGAPSAVGGTVIAKAIEGFKAGFGDRPIGGFAADVQGEFNTGPLVTGAYYAVSSPVELTLKTLSGAIKGVTDAVAGGTEELAKQSGASPGQASLLGRDAGGMIEMLTAAPLHFTGGAITPEVIAKTRETIGKAAPWIDAGREPPVGLDIDIDKLHADQNKLDLDNLSEALKEAAKSSTRERSPEMFADYIRQHTNANIHISSEAIAKLYGDKLPEVDDGVLGWVPRLKEQMDTALATGGDIEVPIAEWLARVEPELAKELHDDIRVRAGGITKNEIKLEKEAAATAKAMIEQDNKPSDENVVNLGEKREEKQVAGFHKELMGEVEKRATEMAKLANQYHEEGKLPLDIGTKFLTAHAKERGLPPWEVIGYRVDPKIPDKYGYLVERGIEGQEGYERSTLNVNDPRNPRIAELAKEFQPFRGPTAVEGVRKASALKPLFEEKERKLALKRFSEEEQSFHDDYGTKTQGFQIIDAEGKPLADLFVGEENGGKRLYVDDIRTLGGRANTIGPRALRDLLQQLKAEFPNAEELTGYRVSGARDKAGSWEKTGKVTIKLAEGNLDDFAAILSGTTREDIGGGVITTEKPTSTYTKFESSIVEQVQSLAARIIPQADTRVVSRVEMGGQEVAGAFVISPKAVRSIVAVALNAKDAGHTLRHEAVHHLRDLFTDTEWKAFEDAAREGEWIGKYNIRERYKKHGVEDEVGLLEEAIAEEYGSWGSNTEAPRKHLNDAVQKGFEKLAAFFREILQAIKEMFGHHVTIDQLFEKIESGEVGRRAVGETEGVAKSKGSIKEPELPGMTRMEDRQPFTGSFPGWMTMRQRERYMQLIEERNTSDVAALEKAIQTQLEREKTQAWKDNKEAVRAEVEAGLGDRPDIAADRYLTTGELYGEKGPRPKILDGDVDVGSSIPKEWRAENGIPADDLAGLFGYPSGRALLDALGKLTGDRTKAGMTPRVFLKRMTDIETDRVMQERYGETPSEVLEAAKDHVLSQTQMDLLHEQTYALASKAGLEFSLTKDQLKAAVGKAFGETPISQLDSSRFLADAGRAGRQMEAAFLKDDAAEAFRQSQRQYLAGLMAKEAVKLEKEIARFDKVAKRFSRREVSGVEQPFTNFIHQLLLQSERPVRRSIQDIDASIAQDGYTSLEHFVSEKVADGWELDVSSQLQADGAKQMERMSANEFREFRDAITSLNHVGRAVKQIIVGGERVDFAEWKADVLKNIRELPVRTKEKQNKLIYGWDSELTRMEEIVKDLDLRREIGPLFNALIRPMMDGKHKEYQMQEALSKTLKEMKQGSKDWQKTLKDQIPNEHFLDPDTGIPFDLTREHMINIMLNFGNRSNIDTFTKGWAEKEAAPLLEAKLREMINRYATKKDWDFAQKMGDIFEGWRKDTDVLYHNLSGLAPKWIPIEPVKTPYGDYRGWYFPLIYDKYYSSIEVIKERPSGNVFGQDYFRATTANRHTRERTGYVDRVEFQNSIDQVASRMQQMIHDISYRAPVMEARKVIYDRQIREAIRKHYGQEYEKQLDPWLKDIANHFNQNEQAISNFNSVLRRARMNLSAHALGLNLKVIGSPDVGSLNPAAVARVLNNYDESVKLAWEKSLEIPHSYRNMDRDFRERLEQTISKSGWSNAQATAVRWAFIPLVKVSQGFRIVTFVDQYKKNLAKGMNDADASAAADSQVRLRHGATGVPDLPAIMRGNEGMKMATMFYGFFNAMYNWQRGIKGDIKNKEWSSALERTYGAVVIPAIFGALLFNKSEKDESLGKHWAKALGLQLLGTVPLARDLGSTIVEGIRPSTPIGSLFQAMSSAYTDVKRYSQGKTVQKPITHAANVVGLGLGLPLAQIGRSTQFGADVYTGKQRPKNIFEWYRGVVHGEIKQK